MWSELIGKFMDWNQIKCTSVLYLYLKPHVYIRIRGLKVSISFLSKIYPNFTSRAALRDACRQTLLTHVCQFCDNITWDFDYFLKQFFCIFHSCIIYKKIYSFNRIGNDIVRNVSASLRHRFDWINFTNCHKYKNITNIS